MKLNKENRGITLVALIVTIIILLILAGISIAQLTGNSLFEKAKEAESDYNITKIEEEIKTKIYELQLEKKGNATLQDLVDYLCEDKNNNYMISLNQIATVTGIKDIGTASKIYLLYEKYQFEIDDKLNVKFIGKSTEEIIEAKSMKLPNEIEISINNLENIVPIFEPSDARVGEIKWTSSDETIVKIENNQLKGLKLGTTSVTAQIELMNGEVLSATSQVIVYNSKTKIKTVEELKVFAQQVNDGKSFENEVVILENDINLQGEEKDTSTWWTPIGTETTPFKGTFNGNKKEISNIYINSTEGNIGLFGYVDTGKIKNLKVSNSILKGHSMVGAICGYGNNANIIRCISYNNVIEGKNMQGIGGIIGANFGVNAIIKECYNTSTVSGVYWEVGGIAGFNYGIIDSCFNMGSINSSYVTIGGIAGGNYNTISNCYNKGTVKSTGSDTFGGIAGYVSVNQYSPSTLSNAIIKNCYNIGTIESVNNFKGGIAGNDVKCEATNNYWLETCGASYGRGSTYSNTGALNKSSTLLKQMATTLGIAYAEDTKNINDGYPILKWQVE